MQKESKRENVPPFLFVGSPVNDIQDCKSIPSSVFAQQDAGVRRLTVASGLVEKKAMVLKRKLLLRHPSGWGMAAKKCWQARAEHPGINALAESYSRAAQTVITSGSSPRVLMSRKKEKSILRKQKPLQIKENPMVSRGLLLKSSGEGRN